MRNRIVPAIVSLLITSAAASAQEPGQPKELLLPGSMNGTFGTVGSLEPDNVLGAVTVEQGIAPWRRGPLSLVGFVDVTLRGDSKGYSWNNTTPILTGMKLVAAGRAGVLQAALGVAGDVRDAELRGVTTAGYVSFWKGWQPPTRQRRMPGRIWATSGILTAREPHNWVTYAHVDQGIAAWTVKTLGVVPFVGVTAVVDTEGYTWNNRGYVDSGLKIQRNIRAAVVDVGVAHRTVREWERAGTQSSPVVFVNFWMGWAPHVVR